MFEVDTIAYRPRELAPAEGETLSLPCANIANQTDAERKRTTIMTVNLQDVTVARLPSHYAWKKSRSYPLSVVLREMQVGSTTLNRPTEVHSSISLREHCQRAVSYRDAGDELEYRKAKMELPAFCPAATLDSNAQVAELSGLLLIEFDDVDAASVMAEVTQLPITIAAWITLSGVGVACIVQPEDPITNVDDYLHAWVSAASAYEHIAEADDSAASAQKLRAMNFTPNLYVNENAIPMKWQHDEEAVEEVFPKRNSPTDIGDIASLPAEYHEAIAHLEWGERGWATEFVPCPFNEHEHDGWDRDTNATGVLKLDGGRGFTMRCFKCEESRRYLRKVDKKTLVRERNASPLTLRRPPARLKKNAMNLPTISLTQSDRQIRDSFTLNSRIIGLNSPTGSGKDHNHIGVVMDSELHSLESKPHRRVAQEKKTRWLEHTSATLWNGITANIEACRGLDMRTREELAFKDDSDIQCISPEIVNELMSRGVNRHETICANCPVRDECYSVGYNAQTEHARTHRAIVVANPQLFTNPTFETHCENLARAEGDEDNEASIRLAFMDEVDPLALFIECQLSLAQLQRWRVMWKDAPLGEFAEKMEEMILSHLSIADMKDYILSIDEQTTISICEQMGHVREKYERIATPTYIPDTGRQISNFSMKFATGKVVPIAKDSTAVEKCKEYGISYIYRSTFTPNVIELSGEEAYNMDIYNVQTGEFDDPVPIKLNFPQLFGEEWNPLRQLQILFKRYRAEDAPISLTGSKDARVLAWEVPPQLHKHIERIICTSATMSQKLFERAFSDYEEDIIFDHIQPTPLTEGSRIFQIRTGKYCRSTVLDKSGKLTASGKRLWKMMQTEVERDTTISHAIISYKSLVGTVDIHGAAKTRGTYTDWIEEQPNVLSYASYGGLTGIDTMKNADVLWVIFDHEPPQADIQRAAQRAWGDHETKLNWTYEDGEYLDQRVQLIWNQFVVGELQQACGRARLNRTKGTIVILTGVNIPQYTDREETQLFDIVDYELDSNLDMLAQRIGEREHAEHVNAETELNVIQACLLYTSPSPRD